MSDAALPASKGKAATINDIARLSGVSKKTVSRIINNSPLVRKDTRDKVEALMREVGYVPDPLARGLAFRRSFLIEIDFMLPFLSRAQERIDPVDVSGASRLRYLGDPSLGDVTTSGASTVDKIGD